MTTIIMVIIIFCSLFLVSIIDVSSHSPGRSILKNQVLFTIAWAFIIILFDLFLTDKISFLSSMGAIWLFTHTFGHMRFMYACSNNKPDTIFTAFASMGIILAIISGILLLPQSQTSSELKQLLPINHDTILLLNIIFIILQWIFSAHIFYKALLKRKENQDTFTSYFLVFIATIFTTIAFIAWTMYNYSAYNFHTMYLYFPVLSVVQIPFYSLAIYKYDFLSQEITDIFKEIFMDASDGMLVVDNKHLVTFANLSASNLFNLHPEKITGQPVSSLIEKYEDKLQMKRFEFSQTSENGQKLTIMASRSTIKTGKNKLGKLIILQNITEEILADEVLKRSKEELELEIEDRMMELVHLEEMEAIGIIAGSIAHDFNNLLASIMGFTTAAIVDLEDNNPIKNDLEEVMIAAKEARDTVNQLLAFSKPHKNKREIVDLNQMIKFIMPLIESSLTPDIKIEYKLKEKEEYIMGHLTDLSQAVMNICTNSICAIGKDSGKVTISICAPATTLGLHYVGNKVDLEQSVEIKVTDTGPGMDQEIITLATEPFFTTKENASGFGLSSSLRIATDHFGGITIGNNKEGGACVSIVLPKLSNFTSPSKAPNALLYGGEHILFVDDDPQIMRMGIRILGSMGYRVSAYSSPREALDDFIKAPGKYDLVITDLAMPLIDGIELSRRMITEKADIPILLVSGKISEGDIITAKNSGIRGYLKKPFALEELAAKIRRLLDEKGRISFPT